MNTRNLIVVASLIVISLPLHAETLTGDMILDGLNVSEAERAKLKNGEVLAFDGEAYESSSRELSADATVLVHKPMSDVLQQIKEVPTIIPQKYLIEYKDVSSAEDFADVGFTLEEYEHANNFLKAKVGKDHNLSQAEVAYLKQVNATAKSRTDRLEAASTAMRKILTDRYQAYMSSGLKGVAPYQRSSRKSISVGNELTLTTETLEPFSKYYPDYYNVLHNYPANTDCCEHIFRWIKVEMRKRPTFALSHTMIEAREDFLLVTERHYYVTNTLNSLQVTVSWVPYDHDTQIGLAISASTDLLDSMMGRILRPLGRNKARDMVTDVLTEIRDDLHAEQ